MSKHTNLFYLKTEQMNLRQLGRMLGYEAIMSCGTKGWAFPQTEISEILLFTLQAWKNLDQKTQAKKPLGQVNVDIFSTSLQSIKENTSENQTHYNDTTMDYNDLNDLQRKSI